MYERIFTAVLILSVLAGCANTPALITKSTSGGPSVINEISPVESDDRVFKFRSFGRSENTYERDVKPVTWKKVDEFVAGRFTIALHAKENEINILGHFLQLPHDNIERMADGSKREVLAKIISEMDVLAERIFQKKAVRARANFYLAIFDTEVKTPITDWQYGPIADPIELNLALMLPPLGEIYEREEGFDDTNWYAQLSRVLLHEYAHVVNKNKPSAFRTNLADEFVASTVEFCSGYLVYEFRNQKINASLLKAGKDYAKDREFITRDKPFATSTTGGQLASTSLAALFSRNELASSSSERWLEVLPQYCKMIVDAKPAFARTNDALDWIEANIQNANLPFLAK